MIKYFFNIKAVILAFLCIFPIYPFTIVMADRLEIKHNKTNKAFLVYGEKSVFAFGASPQNILTYIPEGMSNNYNDWIKWAKQYGITNVRSYPPSIILNSGAEDLFLRSNSDPKKFDLQKFNKKYFEELQKACLLFKENGVIVHLQLWQAVSWKKSWDTCYYNPKNNVNQDISTHAGPNEFVTMENAILLEHQKEYVRMVLNATAHLGNVFYDIMNEIGNGTGVNEEWVWEIIKTINKWEKENNINVLLTLNDEGGMRMGKFSLECEGLDLIVKDLGRYDEHINAKAKYNKPTVSVRNIDWNYTLKKRNYFYGYYNLEVNEDEDLQVRGRKYWWRMFMAGVQSAGGYSDAYRIKDKNIVYKALSKIAEYANLEKYFFSNERRASYRLNLLSENNFGYFIKFVNKIVNYENLIPSDKVLHDHPVSNSYCLQDKKKVVIYLESPNGEAGYHYNSSFATLSGIFLENNNYEGYFYFPNNGGKQSFKIEIKNGKGDLQIPSFNDDLVIAIGNI